MPTPVPDSEHAVAAPVRDPRAAGLDEWEAIQTLCDSLIEAGRAQGRIVPPPITPNTRL